jgi:dihydrofolate reductase
MTKTQYYVASTIDGFIADADDRIDWLLSFGWDTFDEHYKEFMAGVGALVMGSATYRYLLQEELTEWPYQGLPVWVLTSRDLPVAVPGADIRFAYDPVDVVFPQIAHAAGDKNVWVVGGGNVAAQFAEAGLLDELLVTVMPVILGRGKPLLPIAGASGQLTLLGTTAFANGAIELAYRL